MAWDGSGNFTRTDGVRSGDDICQVQEAAGVDITASLMDAELNNIATGLENCMTRDGQNAASGNISMGGNKLTTLADATATGDAVHWGQFAVASWSPTITKAVGGGSISSTSVTFAKYARLEDLIFVYLTFSTTVAGVVTAIDATSPVALETSLPITMYYYSQISGTPKGLGALTTATGTMRFTDPTGSGFTTGINSFYLNATLLSS